MGFYGKVGNTIKTEMYFNLKYSSRYQMEKHCAGDGVGAGAYVLIEYDYNWDETGINITGITSDMLPQVYKNSKNGLFYTDTAYSHLYEPIEETFFQVITDIETSNGVSKRVYEYYLYTQNDEETGYIYKLLTSAESQNSGINYVINFNLDVEKYKHSRGYDSTVWQKVYTEGVPKYVQIAELNSVTPTFRIDVDAPSPIPRPPHFAADSTNILYTLHLQPSWGLRIAKAENNEKSDYKGSYYKYNFKTEKYEEIKNQDLRIYYNKDGFDKNIHNKAPQSNSKNEISLKQASSGQTYINLDHTDNLNSSSYPTSSTENDLYEFRCILPILGDTICHLYDLAYGYDKTIDEYESSRRYTDIAWRQPNSTDSLELRTTDLETIAGCINKTHDLMGMIIYNIDSLPSTVPNSHKEKIVEVNNKYYRVYGYGEITPVTSTTSTDIDWYILLDDEIGDENTYVPSLRWYNAAALGYQENQNLVYLNTNKMVYKYVEMKGFAESLNTIHGCLMRVSQILGDDLPEETRDEQTVKGIINRLSDIINLFGKIKKLQIAVTNSNGVIQTAPIVDDDWIQIDLNKINDGTEVSDISIKHITKFNEDQEYSADINTTTGIKYLTITNLKYDKAGHITELSNGSIDIPFSFKAIGNVNATQMGDTVSITGDNNWISIQNNQENKNIQISHNLKEITPKQTEPIDLKNTDNFIIKTLNYDTAGHIKEENNTTIIPAPAFGQINSIINYTYTIVSDDEDFDYSKGNFYYLDDEGEYQLDISEGITEGRGYYSRSPVEDSIVDHEAQIIANQNFSQFNLIIGNKWIKAFADANNQSITIGHDLLNTDNGNVSTSSLSSFKGEIFIPNFNYDKAGHVYGYSPSSLNLPGFTASSTALETTSKQVLIDYKIEDNGNYSKSFANIGTLPLTDYTTENITIKDIAATDTLNSAIAILEQRIKKLEENSKTT